MREDQLLDPIEVHNALSPTLTKLELLSRLSPLLDTEREYAQVLNTIISMMADYIHEMRTLVDGFVQTETGDHPGGPHNGIDAPF
jgi:hypothetical protein